MHLLELLKETPVSYKVHQILFDQKSNLFLFSSLKEKEFLMMAKKRVVSNITEDSRKLTKNSLFVINPLSLSYFEEVWEKSKKSSIYLLSQNDFKNIKNYMNKQEEKAIKSQKASDSVFLIVKNYEEVCKLQGYLCSRIYEDPSQYLDIVCVTGTNGKTSIAWLLFQIWRNLSIPCAMIGTLGVQYSIKKKNQVQEGEWQTGYTTPNAELLHRILAKLYGKGVKRIVLEASSEALAMGRLDALCFKTALFTNLSPEHLNYHQTMNSYFKAKSKLFIMAKKQNARLIINAKNNWGKKLTHLFLYYPNLEVITEDICTKQELSVPTSFQQENANLVLQTLSKEMKNKNSADKIKYTLKNLIQLPGRFEMIHSKKNEKIFAIIDYAHTPDALEILLKEVKKLKELYLICVFGCGGNRDKKKRAAMGKIASSLSEFLIITDDNPRQEDPKEIREDIKKGLNAFASHQLEEIGDRKTAIFEAVKLALSKTKTTLPIAIVIAGKGHENIQILKNSSIPFSDKKCLQSAFQKLL